MTPYEFINGAPTNMEYFRVWGCKCYVRDPRSDIRKDWSDRSRVGALMVYSETPLGWKVYVPALHKLIMSDSTKKSAEDFLNFVGTRHVDPKYMVKYEVTRIAVTNDKERRVVAYRCSIFLGVVKIVKRNQFT